MYRYIKIWLYFSFIDINTFRCACKCVNTTVNRYVNIE